MKIIGLTGRSGCGKSTVASFFKEHGVCVSDADAVAKMVLEPGSACIPLLQHEFGQDILDQNGYIKRRLLADRAFATNNGSERLIQITHSEIIRILLEQADKASAAGEPIFVVDGAVIIDAPFEKYCDQIILVTASEQISIERICKRDGISSLSAKMRLNSQIPEERLRQKATYIIENDRDKIRLLKRAAEVLKQLQGGVQ